MQARHGTGRRFERCEKLDPLGLKRRHLVLDGSAGHPRLDRFDNPANLALCLIEIAFGAEAVDEISGVSFDQDCLRQRQAAGWAADQQFGCRKR